jgi:CubicO group peptidase (beta-lactamase class C family)
MLRYLVVLLATAIAGFPQAADRMNEAVKMQMAGDRFTGAVLVARHGEILLDQAYGLANREWQIPNMPSTRFRIGSITKQFTAAAILLLEEQGRLRIDDALVNFLPDVPAAWRPITLRQLLSHTSGIPSFTSLPDLAVLRRSPLELEKGLARLYDLPLEFEPGEKYSYSNSGYLLLGLIIEQVSGQGYGAFLRGQILQPLGLKDTDCDSNTAIIPLRASGYVINAGRHENAPYINMEVAHAAGALYSTTHDLLHWTRALFGGRLLSAASLGKMTAPGKGNYGLGLVVQTVNGRKLIEHAGSIEGFNSHLAHYPGSGITVVVLANINGAAATKLAGQLGDLAHGDREVHPARMFNKAGDPSRCFSDPPRKAPFVPPGSVPPPPPRGLSRRPWALDGTGVVPVPWHLRVVCPPLRPLPAWEPGFVPLHSWAKVLATCLTTVTLVEQPAASGPSCVAGQHDPGLADKSFRPGQASAPAYGFFLGHANFTKPD